MMSVSLKAELETWAAALKAYDEQDFGEALESFSRIRDSSKVLTNMGLIYATIGEHETAVEHFVAATKLDSYLAIAHFQCGVSNFLIQRYDLALLNFEDAYLYLRGNEAINYEQIGLKFKLFSAEILFNKGLTQLNLGYVEKGMADMQEASRQKVTNEHGVIDEAIRDRGEGYTVFSIPVGVVYRPSENKVKNSKTKNYLGKAKLVAASDSNDAFTEFTGVRKLKQATDDNPDNKEDDNDRPAPGRNTAPSVPRTVAARHTTLGRSKTTSQCSAVVRPDAATILASRRTQSVLNPANVPQLTGLSRHNMTRADRNATTTLVVTSLRAKTPQGTAVGIASSAGGARAAEEAGTTTDGGAATLRRPNLWKVRELGTSQVVPLPATQPSSAFIHPGVCHPSVVGDHDAFEMANIRVKLHYQGDVRRMTMRPTTTFDNFVERVTAKFGTSVMGLGLKFVDEEGLKISLRDEDDFDLAIETARENAGGKSEGKLEVWCVDV